MKKTRSKKSRDTVPLSRPKLGLGSITRSGRQVATRDKLQNLSKYFPFEGFVSIHLCNRAAGVNGIGKTVYTALWCLSALQQPVLYPDVSARQSVLSLNVSAIQQPMLSLDASVP